MLIKQPVFPASINKSVCLERNAGIWIISTFPLRNLTSSIEWASVITGTLSSFFISDNISIPLTKPGPRNESKDVRFALS